MSSIRQQDRELAVPSESELRAAFEASELRGEYVSLAEYRANNDEWRKSLRTWIDAELGAREEAACQADRSRTLCVVLTFVVLTVLVSVVTDATTRQAAAAMLMTLAFSVIGCGAWIARRRKGRRG